MDFNFFLNDIFYQIFNMNLNKIIWRFFLNFQEYSRNISPKAITNVVKTQAGVAHAILFAPNYNNSRI